jgi:hypothetical protein
MKKICPVCKTATKDLKRFVRDGEIIYVHRVKGGTTRPCITNEKEEAERKKS